MEVEGYKRLRIMERELMTLFYEFGNQEILFVKGEPFPRLLPSASATGFSKKGNIKTFTLWMSFTEKEAMWKEVPPQGTKGWKLKATKNGTGKLPRKEDTRKISYFCCQIAIRNSINVKCWVGERMCMNVSLWFIKEETKNRFKFLFEGSPGGSIS